MTIKAYEEYISRHEEIKDLDVKNQEVLYHFDEIFPTLDNSDYENGIIVDVQKNKG